MVGFLLKSTLWIVVLFLLRLEFNNGEGSLSIFIPLVFIWILSTGVRRVLSGTDDIAAVTGVFTTLAFGISYILLWIECGENRNGLIQVMKALVIMAVAGAVAYFTNADIRYSQSLKDMVSMYVFGSLVIVAGTPLSGLFSRRRFTLTSFVPRLILWQVLCSILLMAISIVILTVIQGRSTGEVIFLSAVTGGAVGVFLLVVTAPFTVLVFCNEFYRERFEAMVGHVPETEGGVG